VAAAFCCLHANAPAGAKTYSPAFEITLAALIAVIITQGGMIQPVSADSVRKLIAGRQGPGVRS